MADLSANTRKFLSDYYNGQIQHAVSALVEHRRAVIRVADLASDLGISQTEQEADYQAALARAEARG